MVKFREKWIWALCFAILVHVGVFFIFYLNMDKDSSKEINNSSEITSTIKTAEPLTTIDSNDSYSPSNSKIYTTTLKNDKAIKNVDTNSEQTKAIAPEEQLSSAATNDKADSAKAKSLRDDNNLISTEADLISANNQTLNAIKNEASLLDTDVPIQKEQVKIDKEYLSMKSEVEEVNNRLSAAIDEVKKRNQQKIDQMEQQKTGSDISSNEYIIERSE